MENKNYIIDSNVLFSSIFKPFSNAEKSLLYVTENGNLCFSQNTIFEIEEVLFRTEFDVYFPNNERAFFLKSIKEKALFFDPKEKIFFDRDKKDEKFLSLAIECNAKFLITGDKDLLEVKKMGETKIVTPTEFIETMGI